MRLSRLLRHAASFAALLAGIVAAQAQAQQTAYPNRAIRWIVPLPPGGGADIVARTIAERLARSLGQQVLVDNPPAAARSSAPSLQHGPRRMATPGC